MRYSLPTWVRAGDEDNSRRCDVDVPAGPAVEEIARLRDRIDELRHVIAGPELWANGAPPPRVTQLLEGIPEMLDRIAHPANALNELIQEFRPDAAQPEDALREDERLSRVL